MREGQTQRAYLALSVLTIGYYCCGSDTVYSLAVSCQITGATRASSFRRRSSRSPTAEHAQLRGASRAGRGAAAIGTEAARESARAAGHAAAAAQHRRAVVDHLVAAQAEDQSVAVAPRCRARGAGAAAPRGRAVGHAGRSGLRAVDLLTHSLDAAHQARAVAGARRIGGAGRDAASRARALDAGRVIGETR